MEMDYRNIAIEQFYKLKNETLDEDRYILGAENEINYDINGLKFKIKVDGYWEKSTWFDWVVYNENGVEIEKGTEW